MISVTATGPLNSAPISAVDSNDLALTAAEALIMTGTAMPEVTPEWMAFVSENFIHPAIGSDYVNTPVTTPGQFWPFTGKDSLSLDLSTQIGAQILDAVLQSLITSNAAAGTADDPIAVFGYSQSAWLAAISKHDMVARKAGGGYVPPTDFVMLANPIRPNGGLFSRFFGFGQVTWTPVLSAPTNTPFATYDIARQYDFFADFPVYPLNLLADINAVFGVLNHDYSSVTIDPTDSNYDPNTVVEHYGDTTYYLVPSTLPMLYPLRWVGLSRVADFLEPVLKVYVELGYDRQTPYGQATAFKLFPKIDRDQLRTEVRAALKEGQAAWNAAAPQPKSALAAASADTSAADVAAPREASRADRSQDAVRVPRALTRTHSPGARHASARDAAAEDADARDADAQDTGNQRRVRQ